MARGYEIGTSCDFMGAMWTDHAQYTRVVPVSEFPGITIAEMVGVGSNSRIARLAEGLRSQGVTPVQIHGATGYSGHEPWYDAAKVRAISVFLPTPEKIYRGFPTLDLVMHAPALRALLEHGARRTDGRQHGSRWLIENHDNGLAGITHAIALASRARDRGMHTGVIVDVGHATRRLTGDAFDKMWGSLTNYLARMTGERSSICGLHIPVGTFADDSLPNTLTHAHRNDLLASLGPSVKRVIFEYQRGGAFGLFHLFSREERRERGRMSRIFADWGKAGLFTATEGTR